MRLVVFSLVLAAAAAAQTANPTNSSNPTDPPKKARLEGAVVSLTGEAIPRATLRLQGGSIQPGQLATGMSATADDAGKFVFPEVEPGRNYQLSAQRPGYIPARYGSRSSTAPGAPLSLDEGQVIKGLIITMTPQGVISGKVVDKDNDLIQGATVILLRSGYQRGVRTMVTSNASSTNDQGEYRIANLPPGRYYLVVTDRRGVQTAAVPGAEGNLTTYYPSVTDAQSAAPLNVTPGLELRGMDVKMRSGRMFTVRGKAVNSSTGAPASGVILSTIAKQADNTQPLGILAQLGQGSTQSAKDGSFEVRNLPAGTWNIHSVGNVALNGVATPRLSGNIDVTVGDADVSGLLLQLGPGVSITGSVRVEDGDIKTVFPSLAQGAATTGPTALVTDGAGGIILLGGRPAVALSEIVLSGGAPPPGQLSEDGTFKIDSINPGKFALNMVQLPQGYYVKSARFGGADVTHAALDFTSGAGGSLDIVLSNKSADVSGSLRNEKGEPMTGIMVALWTKDPDLGSTTNGVRTTYTDQNGGFQFRGLPPGEYYVAAWEDADSAQVQNRDLLAMFADDESKVKLTEGAKESKDAKLITSERLVMAMGKLP